MTSNGKRARAAGAVNPIVAGLVAILVIGCGGSGGGTTGGGGTGGDSTGSGITGSGDTGGGGTGSGDTGGSSGSGGTGAPLCEGIPGAGVALDLFDPAALDEEFVADDITGQVVEMGVGGLTGKCGRHGELADAWWIRIDDGAGKVRVACVDSPDVAASLSMGQTVTATERVQSAPFSDGSNDLTITRAGELVLYAIDAAAVDFEPPTGIAYESGGEVCTTAGGPCQNAQLEVALTAGGDQAAVSPASTGTLGAYTVYVGTNYVVLSDLVCDAPLKGMKMWIGRQ